MNEELEMADNQVEVADPQITDEANEQDEVQVEQEVVEPVTETKAFSERLKAQTQKAIDDEYSKLYGADYGIHSKAEYDNYMEKMRIQAEAEEKNIDPELYEEVTNLKKEVMQYRTEKTMIQQDEQLSKDETVGDIYREYKDEIKEMALGFNGELKGNLEIATTLFIKNNIKNILNQSKTSAEQEAVQTIIQNQKTTPGSLSSGTDNVKSTVSNLSKTDFKDVMNQVLMGTRKSI